MNKTTWYGYEQIIGKDYPITNQISAGRNAKSYLNPTYKLPKLSGMQSGVGDTGDTKYITQTSNP